MHEISGEFLSFGKIPRLSRECVVTEKIDGTNGQILILENGEMLVGSRSRWLTKEADNFGFYKWAMENKEDLLKLGPGRHFGEWWGSGIQSGYGLKEKRFSLFNTSKWTIDRPACCHCVPVLYQGLFNTTQIYSFLSGLINSGSVAAPGFMDPEGIIIYHVAGGIYFKKTIHGDQEPKGTQ